jgi:carbon storage regulator
VLVLTRKSEEGIRIGNDVRIVVLSTARGHVRIGIEAPSGVSVLREEVHLRIAE